MKRLTHLVPHAVITILLTILTMLYFTLPIKIPPFHGALLIIKQTHKNSSYAKINNSPMLTQLSLPYLFEDLVIGMVYFNI